MKSKFIIVIVILSFTLIVAIGRNLLDKIFHNTLELTDKIVSIPIWTMSPEIPEARGSKLLQVLYRQRSSAIAQGLSQILNKTNVNMEIR